MNHRSASKLAKANRPSDTVILAKYAEVDALDMGDGATFHMLADRLGCDYADACEWLSEAVRRQERRQRSGQAVKS